MRIEQKKTSVSVLRKCCSGTFICWHWFSVNRLVMSPSESSIYWALAQCASASVYILELFVVIRFGVCPRTESSIYWARAQEAQATVDIFKLFAIIRFGVMLCTEASMNWALAVKALAAVNVILIIANCFGSVAIRFRFNNKPGTPALSTGKKTHPKNSYKCPDRTHKCEEGGSRGSGTHGGRPGRYVCPGRSGDHWQGTGSRLTIVVSNLDTPFSTLMK